MPSNLTSPPKDSAYNDLKEKGSGKEGMLHYSTKNSHIAVLYPPTNTDTEPVSGQPQVVAKRKVKLASMWWPNACTATSIPTSIGSFTYTSPEILNRFGFVDGDRFPIPAKYELRAPPAPTLGGHIHTIIPSTVTKSGSNLLKTLKYLTNSVETKKGKNEGSVLTNTALTTTTGSTFLDNIPAHSMLRETVLSAFDGSRLILDWRFADSSRRQHRRSNDSDSNNESQEEDAVPAIQVVVGAPGVMEGDLNHAQSPTYLDDFAPPSSWREQLGVVAITFPSKKKNVEETATPLSPSSATPLQPSHQRRRIPIKRGIFVILPGLTSSIESGYIQSLVLHASSPFHGFDVVVANARGLGQVDTFLDAPNMFCAAFTDDTKHLLLNEVSHEGLSRRGMYFAPDNNKPIPVVVAGFSFGGIILSRALGEIGQRIPVKVAKQISSLVTNHKHHFTTTNTNGNDSQPSTNEDLVNAALHAHGSRTHRTLGPNETMNIVAAGTVCSPLDMEATNHFYTSKRINYLLYRSPLVEGLLDYIRRHSHILITSEHASLRQVATLEIEKEIQLEKKKKPDSASTKNITYFESYLRIKRKQALAGITADQRKQTQIEADFRVTPQSVWELEKCVIAPVFGFEDHFDYYRKSTPIVPGHLDGSALIRTPLPSTLPSSTSVGGSSGTTTNNNGLIPIFCLCAEDDPIVGPGLTQRQQEELCERWWSHNQRSAPRNDDCGGGGIVVYNCSNGGHLGFLKGIFEEHKDSARLSQIASKQAALDKIGLGVGNDSPPSVSRVVVTQADIDWAHDLVYRDADSWCPNFMEEFVVTAMRNALVTN